MGDILHALPAVTALRQAHPAWSIDWVVEPMWKSLLSAGTGREDRGPAQPVADRLLYAATKSWRKHLLGRATLHELNALCRELKSGAYDAVLDLQGAVRSSLICKLTGCRRRIGEANPRETMARWFFTEPVVTRGEHVIEQDLELASSVAGDELEPVQAALPVDQAAELWCDGLMASGPREPVVLLNPGAGWGAKRWPAGRYAAVAAELSQRGFRVLVNAGPGEETLAAAVQAHSDGRAVPVSCSLAQLIALTRRVALVIAGDTGPLHLACALGRPVVGIYGPTDPSRNGPYGTRFRVLRSPDSRRDHRRYEAAEAGLLTISPQEVLQAAEQLVAEEAVE